MADHSGFVAIATRLIAKHGRTVTLKGMGAAVDPTKPWRGSDPTAPVALGEALAVFVPHKGFEFGSDFVSDELLMKVDEVCMVAGGNDAFDTATHMTDEGVEYKIHWTQRLRPADTTILYAFGICR